MKAMNILKETIEWRIIATLIAFLVTYLWTGEIIKATGLTFVLAISKSAGYYTWRKIKE